jgi:hypothetical protein
MKAIPLIEGTRAYAAVQPKLFQANSLGMFFQLSQNSPSNTFPPGLSRHIALFDLAFIVKSSHTDDSAGRIFCDKYLEIRIANSLVNTFSRPRKPILTRMYLALYPLLG